MTTPTVTVTMPNGTNTIANPLYAYRFHKVSKEDFYYDPVSLLRYTVTYINLQLTLHSGLPGHLPCAHPTMETSMP